MDHKIIINKEETKEPIYKHRNTVIFTEAVIVNYAIECSKIVALDNIMFMSDVRASEIICHGNITAGESKYPIRGEKIICHSLSPDRIVITNSLEADRYIAAVELRGGRLTSKGCIAAKVIEAGKVTGTEVAADSLDCTKLDAAVVRAGELAVHGYAIIGKSIEAKAGRIVELVAPRYYMPLPDISPNLVIGRYRLSGINMAERKAWIDIINGLIANEQNTSNLAKLYALKHSVESSCWDDIAKRAVKAKGAILGNRALKALPETIKLVLEKNLEIWSTDKEE